MSNTKMIVNLDALHENISAIFCYKSGAFLFVLKGNAYGHGYLPILRELEQYDQVSYIGVATPNEAIYLSKYTSKRIVILGYTPDEKIGEVINQNIIPTIFTYHQATLIDQDSDVFINIDTGFHRLGGTATNSFVEEIQSIQLLPKVSIKGVFTHLALRKMKDDLNSIASFEHLTRNLNIPFVSISDSIAYTRYNTNENLYRIGASLFGLTSTKELGKLDLEPTTQLITYVTNIQTASKDEHVFYRSKVSKGTSFATIQIGYADGLFRTMPKESYVLINNQPCPYIEVGMDQSVVDVTGMTIAVGDTVTIFNTTSLPLEQLALWCNTNKNNILTMIGSRVVREYWKQGKLISKLDIEGESNETGY